MKSPLKPEEEQRVVKFLCEFKRDILNATEQARKVWLELYRNYRFFKSTGKKDWQSKLWIPKTFTAIEQIASRTTAHNPKFNLIALQASAIEFFTANQAEIDEAIASEKLSKEDIGKVPKKMPQPKVYGAKDILEAYLSYVFSERKLKKKIRLWDKGRLMYGTYHVKIDSGIITKKKKRVEDDDDGNEVEIEEEIFKNVLPDVNTIDIFDFLIHPLEEDLDSAYGVIHHRDSVNINELDPDDYFNLDLIKNGGSSSEKISEKIAKDNYISHQSEVKIDKNSFKVDEYYGKFSLTGEPEDEKEYIFTVAQDSILISFEENTNEDPRGGYVRPFVAMHDQPVPGEYYSIGEAEPIMSLQEEVNHLRNTRVDFNNSLLYPEWVVRKNSGINPFQLVHKPNNIIMVDNPQDIQPMQKPVLPQSSYQEEDIINRDIQDTTSTTNYAQPGATSAFTDTVTGASMRTQEQSTRMRMKIEYLDDAVAELGRKILLIAAHEIEDHIEIRKGEMEFISIYKDAFKKMARGFSPQVVTGSMAADTPSEKRNEAIARGNISMQYAQAGVPVNLNEEYKNIMESGFNVKDIDSLLGDTTKQPIVKEEQGAAQGGMPSAEGQPMPEPTQQQEAQLTPTKPLQ